MKFLIVLTICIAGASAQAIIAAGIANTGTSAVSRSEDGLGNYAFGYNEDHAFGGTFRKEKGAPGMQVGSYGLREADGRMRVVNYVADALGFRASVSTNEPGTDIKQDPAAVSMNAGHVAAPVAVAAATPMAFAGPAMAAAPMAMATGTPVMAKAFGAPMMVGRSFGAPMAIAAAPVTAHSFHSATRHIAGTPMMANAFHAAPFAKTFML